MLLTTTWQPLAVYCDVIVVGVSFYQRALEKICGGRREEGVELLMQAQIIPYDDNPEDAHAVRIEIEGETIGHLSRTSARKWRSKMISESFSGAVACPAKIIWDRAFDKAGSYGAWLNVDLTLPDSKPERLSVNGVVVTTKQSDHIEFLVNELNRFELLNCKVGDEVHFWEAGDSKEIFIYRLGTAPGHGKIGICPNSVYQVLHAAPGCDASIASIYEDGCKVDCRIVSKAEMAGRSARYKAAEKVAKNLRVQACRDKLRFELEKKYSPKTSINAMCDFKCNYKWSIGDKVYLDIKDKKYYLRNAANLLRIDLLDHNKEKIGVLGPADIVIRILKAHYNGYCFDLNLIYPCDNEYYPHTWIEIVPKK